MTPGERSDKITSLTECPEFIALREKRDALKAQLQRFVLGQAGVDEYVTGHEADLRRQISKLTDDLNSLLENGMKTVLIC